MLLMMIINKIQECCTLLFQINRLVEISNHIILKIFNAEFPDIKVWFTDQNSQPFKIEDRINLTLVIK